MFEYQRWQFSPSSTFWLSTVKPKPNYPKVEKEAQVFLTNHTTLRNWSNLYLVWLSKENCIMLMIEFIFLLDFNECQLNNAGCEHICANSEGSYNCDCRKGFKLKDDKFGCEGKFGIRSLFAWEKKPTGIR